MYERMQVVDSNDIETIHRASLHILADVGVAFHEPDAVATFKRHGASVSGDVVFLDERLVRQALASAPRRFRLHARNPDKSVFLGGDGLALAPAYGPVMRVDSQGTQTKAVMTDYDNLCRLVQTSSVIDVNGCIMVDPSDRDPQLVHLDMMRSNITLCDKACVGHVGSRRSARDAVRMMQIAWQQDLADTPAMIGIISSLSPLHYSAEMSGALIEYARHGQACLIGGLMQAGATGPVSLPGVLALHNAELLAGITLTQLVNPGSPVVYGTTSTVTDMRTGSLAVGAPELSLIQNAFVQLAKFYGLPSRGSGGVTDSHLPDAQAGIESTLALTTTIMSGANFVLHACGVLASFLCLSYEKFLIDEEICGMLKRMLRPLDVTPERIDLATIKAVGIGGEYLTHPSTCAQCRSEYHLSRLANRFDYHTWRAAGAPRLEQNASRQFEQRLAAYSRPDIDPGIERDLRRYVATGGGAWSPVRRSEPRHRKPETRHPKPFSPPGAPTHDLPRGQRPNQLRRAHRHHPDGKLHATPRRARWTSRRSKTRSSM